MPLVQPAAWSTELKQSPRTIEHYKGMMTIRNTFIRVWVKEAIIGRRLINVPEIPDGALFCIKIISRLFVKISLFNVKDLINFFGKLSNLKTNRPAWWPSLLILLQQALASHIGVMVQVLAIALSIQSTALGLGKQRSSTHVLRLLHPHGSGQGESWH